MAGGTSAQENEKNAQSVSLAVGSGDAALKSSAAARQAHSAL